MSKHLGDYNPATVIHGKFSTFRPSTGETYALAGSPALAVYKDGNTAESTTGITLTTNFDSRTGLHHFIIDTSADGSFYAAGSFFDLVLTAGSVDSVSIAGSVIASFTLRMDSALKPTVAGRTLDVSTGGEAGIDWANIGSPASTATLSGTTVKTAADVETRATDIQNRLPAALVSGKMDSYVSSMPVAADIADAVWDEAISGHLGIGSTGATLNAAGASSDPWSVPVPGSYGPGTAGAILGNNLDAKVSLVKAKTDNLPVNPAATGDAMTLTSAYDAAKTAAQPGSAMTLTAGERTTLAGVIWAALTSALTTAGSIGKLLVDNIDAKISSRSTYSGGDTPGTTTLLARLTQPRADNLDNLDQPVSATAFNVWTNSVRSLTDKANFSLTSAYDAAKTAGDATRAKQDEILAKVPDLASIVSGVWGAASRTLTGFGSLVSDIWAATARSLTDKQDFSLTSAYDAAKTAASPAEVTAAVPDTAQIADRILERNIGGGTDSGRTVQDALRALRNRVDSRTTQGFAVIYKEDDTTEAWRTLLTMDQNARPVVESDPD